MNMRFIFQVLPLLMVSMMLLTTACEQAGENPASVSDSDTETTVPSIVYINADTILANYTVFQERGAVLAQREQEETAKLQQKGRALEQEVQAIQNKVQQGLLAPNQIAKEEQRIGRKQQELMQERERISQELMMEGQKLNQELQEKLNVVLKALQSERGYDYILSYGPGTGVLMANEELDITQDVLSRLNAVTEVDTTDTE